MRALGSVAELEAAAARDVEDDRLGLVGLFCLAVAPDARRAGLGTASIRGILAGCGAPLAYPRVEEGNVGALAVYDRLGFDRVYRYQHVVAPDRDGDRR